MTEELALAHEVAELRRAYKAALADKARQAREELDYMRQEYESILVEEYDRSRNIARLCRIYGTGDRRTIYDILDKWGVTR